MGDVHAAGGRRQHDDRLDGRRDAAGQRGRRGHAGDRGVRTPCSTSPASTTPTRATSSTRELFPNRIIVGSETFPDDIDELWRLVRDNPHVIGDFTWTGWDYLGEAGIGRVDYPDEDYVPTGISAPYPWLAGWVGDIDITGHRRPHVLLPRDRLRAPAQALHRRPPPAVPRAPDAHDAVVVDATRCRAGAGTSPPDRPPTVDVYSDADEVELLLNGRSIGRVGRGRREAVPRPLRGELRARRAGRRRLHGGRGAGAHGAADGRRPARASCASADRDAIRADDTDLAYVAITLQDDDGNLASHRDRLVSVDVSGPGVLRGLGSATPRTEERFGASQCTTFDGRALAIVPSHRPRRHRDPRQRGAAASPSRPR